LRVLLYTQTVEMGKPARQWGWVI